MNERTRRAIAPDMEIRSMVAFYLQQNKNNGSI
jgi:hypothetical protein